MSFIKHIALLRWLAKGMLAMSFVLAFVAAQAQQSAGVWGQAKEGAGRIRGKAQKKVSALKAWKEYLEQWGLDTSYTRSFAVFGRLNSDGWSGGIAYGRKTKRGKLGLWQLSLSEVKHEKETKQQRTGTAFPELGSGAPYIFGKINNVYLLQLGYNKEQVLLPALFEGNVSVGLHYGGGLSLAMLKPYYLDIIHPDYTTNPATAYDQEERYSELNKEAFLNYSLINGRGQWSKGLSEMQYLPGLYGETALCIQPGKAKSFVQTVCLGINASVYTGNLEFMADNKAYPWRVCLFAALEVGKRW